MDNGGHLAATCGQCFWHQIGTMIPVRKVKGRAKPWLLDLRSVGAGREFFATRQEAENARASSIEDLKSHGAAGLDLTAAERAEYSTAREQLREVGATVPEAVRFFLEHRRERKMQLMSVAIRECLKAKLATNKRTVYVDKLGCQARASLASLGGRDPLVHEVTSGEVAAWLHGNGWKPSTSRTKWIDLQTFVRWCRRQGWPDSDPTAGIERETLDASAKDILNTT